MEHDGWSRAPQAPIGKRRLPRTNARSTAKKRKIAISRAKERRRLSRPGERSFHVISFLLSFSVWPLPSGRAAGASPPPCSRGTKKAKNRDRAPISENLGRASFHSLSTLFLNLPLPSTPLHHHHPPSQPPHATTLNRPSSATPPTSRSSSPTPASPPRRRRTSSSASARRPASTPRRSTSSACSSTTTASSPPTRSSSRSRSSTAASPTPRSPSCARPSSSSRSSSS